jgi:hypothetical protein
MRIRLGGLGIPIPGIALPDPNLSGERPTQEIIFADGDEFHKDTWISLGYTHYEVWCVGAAGGQGGGMAGVQWDVTTEQLVTPLNVWNAWKDLWRYGAPIYVSEAGRWMTQAEHMEYTNPAHLGWVNTWHRSYLGIGGFEGVLSPEAIGGAGGGGGVHVVPGILADLPDVVPVTVGTSGSDGSFGQVETPEELTLEPHFWALRDHHFWGAEDSRYYDDPYDMALLQILNPWFERWPEPHNSLPPPGNGQDGGASSFGDIAMASGGKGGGKCVSWVGEDRFLSGHGGDGGLGGRLIPGGGGLGSKNFANGLDGSWDGAIGGGGGGGRGGASGPRPRRIMYSVPRALVHQLTSDKLWPDGVSIAGRKATAGGRGSFSYADTSVYGQRQYPTTYGAVDANYAEYNWTSGELLNIVPGGGGGVRAVRKRMVGSDAQSYSPDGLTLIRLIKIE